MPAATSIINQMGLEEYLYGVTFECPSGKPIVVRSHLEGKDYTSAEIDRIVSESRQLNKGLYYVDELLLKNIAPDIIFTQDVCDVCQISTSYIERALHQLKKQPRVIPLTPRNLCDIYDNAVTIARALELEEAAYSLLAQLKKRTDHITDQLRKHNAPVKRVLVMEWMDPVYNCGHWIPDLISHAGGVDMLSNPSGYSVITPWEKITRYDPEVIVIAPCGFTTTRAMKEMHTLSSRDGWNNLAAVKQNAVYFADANLFTCPSLHVVDGIELLSALFHPRLFELPQHFKNNMIHFDTSVTIH